MVSSQDVIDTEVTDEVLTHFLTESDDADTGLRPSTIILQQYVAYQSDPNLVKHL